MDVLFNTRCVTVNKDLFSVNCYIVSCNKTNECAIIDPGAAKEHEIEEILNLTQGKTVRYVINTHGHLDHIWGNAEILKRTGAPLLIHAADKDFLSDAEKNGSLYFGVRIASHEPAKLLNDNDSLPLGEGFLTIVHTPGHTPGGICIKYDNALVTGDTLFCNGIGRTDLVGGDERQLYKSLAQKLLPFPDNTILYPGHGPSTTMQHERAFLTGLLAANAFY